MGNESLIMQEEIDRKELLDDTQSLRNFLNRCGTNEMIKMHNSRINKKRAYELEIKETDNKNLDELFDSIQLSFIQDNPNLEFDFITFLKTYNDYAKSYIRKD